MTSLREAFGEASGRSWGAERRGGEQGSAGARDPHYTDPVRPRYEDTGGDEAERRYAYERSRQELYAKSAPQTSSAHPVLSSQEAFQQLLPGGHHEPADAQVSCSTCRNSMSCSGEDVFCRHCNHACLQQKQKGSGGGPATSIANLWQ
jgi:hypothetical protein